MSLVAHLIAAAVMLLHVYIFMLETVLFRSRGYKVFGMTHDKIDVMAPAMSNQGCYNAFLAAALALGLVLPNAATAQAFTVFGLTCVAVAGVWGAATVSRRIFFVQTVPAVLGLAALALA
ncbi:DUF1304 domain-containing protein [Curvibacter sp. APW13]|uniref:DUF1304 domain-containing protein n=1 Tax=Curvibacter sp. APW13 TaxID=3077236 RepID=UPI0028DD9096|nr:DUF1304 domain-containing protein [Curvibacter sp. APW13]MDT8990657.1 DUF1304 domain-containing protein [Curvibacter sp. APW13]